MVCFLILKDESGSRQDNPLFGIMPLAMSPTDNLSERRAGKAYVVQLTIIQQFQPFDQHRFFPYAKEHTQKVLGQAARRLLWHQSVDRFHFSLFLQGSRAGMTPQDTAVSNHDLAAVYGGLMSCRAT
jgi:hypothetical protein